jgi:hypothetical protein
MTKPNKIGFIFQSVKTEEFATFEDNFDVKKTVNLETGIDLKVNQHKKQIGIFITFEYLQKGKVFLKIRVGCHFAVEDISWSQLLNSEKKELFLPKGFVTHLLVLSIGTVRGILVAKTEGTVFSRFILPTLNVSEKVENDVIIELDNQKEFA